MEYKIYFRGRGYIAHPYWPDRDKLVNIQKQSGMTRARSEDKRDAALRRYLEKLGLTIDDYKKLETSANREWYTNKAGYIIVPSHQIEGCLVQACRSAPAGCRFVQEQLRSLLTVSDFVTDKKHGDKVYERFVLPTDAKGHLLSNQRRLTKNEVIIDFTAVGTICFDKSDTSEKSVKELLTYAGKYIGVGSCRKMGYGRFET